jgi:hypothetical protein
MTSLPDSAIAAAVAQANAQGMRAYVLNVTGSPTDGCAGHPGVGGHSAMAKAAIALISSVMGW